MRINVVSFFIVFVFFATGVLSPQCQICDKIYVWDFTTDGLISTTIADRLSRHFEIALTQINSCKVLQRKNFSRLESLRKTEKSILSIRNLPKGVRGECR